MNIIPMGAKATGEVERDHWQTPKYILELVNQLFSLVKTDGWLDPCPIGAGDADNVFKAENLADLIRFDLPWYINPPFSRYAEFVETLLGKSSEQIWISHTNNSTGWYKQLLEASSAIILIDHRVRFVDPTTGEQSKQTAFGKSQTIFYVGPRVKEFCEIFSALGQPMVKPRA